MQERRAPGEALRDHATGDAGGPSAAHDDDHAVRREPARRGAAVSDFASIDDVIEVWYGAVSGPAGVPRDWSRDARLYVPGVRFVQTGESDGKPWHRIEVRD